jgi:hypothetical protein
MLKLLLPIKFLDQLLVKEDGILTRMEHDLVFHLKGEKRGPGSQKSEICRVQKLNIDPQTVIKICITNSR